MMILLYSGVFVSVVVISLVSFIYLAPARAVEMGLNTTRKQSGLRRKEITISTGLHYSYLEGGQGEPLLLLHGFGGNKDTFTRVSRYLVKQYRVIIPDIIGFGESTHLEVADYSPAAQVERLRTFVQALNLQSVHLGGNSMGGQIALVYAALYPDEVKSIWLLSPLVSKDSFKSHILNALTESSNNPLIARTSKEFKEVMTLGMRRPPFIPKPMLKLLAQERIDNADLEEDIFEQIVTHSIDTHIRDLVAPSLIVFGNKDRVLSSKTANVLNKYLTNTRLVFMQDTGHVPMFEEPRKCALDYISFRESLADLSI